MSFRKISAIALLAAVLSVTSKVHAIGGIAIQYGLDMSLKMDDKLKESAIFDSLKLNVTSITGTNPGGLSGTIHGSDVPVYINRTDWKRSVFNIGGKIYVDVIPVIDAIELSSNFGIWEYQGSVTYPKSMAFKTVQPIDPNAHFIDRVDIIDTTVPVTLKSFGINYIGGITGTPYAKLQFDATVRKTLVSFPPIVKILKIYAGGGPTVQFATPILSASLVKEALEAKFDTTYSVSTLNSDLFGNTAVMKPIVDKILAKLMTPHYGMHLDVGAMVKIPIIPLALYVDGKYLIPFGKLDANLTQSSGLLINMGTAFAL